MRRAWAYLGPVLLAVGAWLAAPNPHPVFPNLVPLVLAAAAAVLGLVGVHWGSQAAVGLALVAGVAGQLPPIVPMGWIGPALTVVGLALSLEGAASRDTGIPMAPLRAWGLPLGLTLAGALVALAALTTQVGRESLDITQGLGLAVSAPFLVAAAWGVLKAVRTRGEEGTGSGLLAVVLAAGVLLAGVTLLVPPEASAQDQQAQCDFRNQTFGAGCEPRLAVLARPNSTENATDETYTLTSDDVLLTDLGFHPGYWRNRTISFATLQLPTQADTSGNCPGTRVTLKRATQAWPEDATVDQVPPGADPVNLTRSQENCLSGSSLSADVAEQLEAWAAGAPVQGWRLSLASGQAFNGDNPWQLTYEALPNHPRIRNVTLTPEPHDGIVMAPVGERLAVEAKIFDPRGGTREVELRFGPRMLTNVSLGANDGGNLTANLSYAVDGSTANGTLEMRVIDWDNRTAHDDIAELRPDRETPTLLPGENATVEVTDEGWRIPEPIPRDKRRTLTLNVSDDACEFVQDCMQLFVTNETGQIANRTGNDTLTVPLPTDRAGDHTVTLTLEDAAGRLNTTELSYRVSEPVDPSLTGLAVTDGLGRSDQQEAGLPLEVNLTLADESPPIELAVSTSDRSLLTRTVSNETATLHLTPVIEQAGGHTLVLEATDRWGNTAELLHGVEILPARSPRITLPNRTWLASGSILEATVTDASVAPENASIQVLRGGTPMAGVDVAKRLTETGVAVSIELPQLLHGEQIRVIASATDRLGRFATQTSDHRADALAPEIDVEPTAGARVGGTLWTLPEAELVVSAEDPDSGLATLRLTEPGSRSLDPTGATIPVSDLGTERFRIEARDAVGNAANVTARLAIDREAPSVELGIDGHQAVVTVREDESGLARVHLTADGQPLQVPRVPGTHRVTIPDVQRGDVVNLTLLAEDKVGRAGNVTRTLTVEDAPPELRLGTLGEGSIRAFATDPDGDAVEVDARAIHLVNGSRVTLDPSANGTLELPNWEGDVRLVVDAEAHNATTTRTRTLVLGEGPYLHAQVPSDAQPGNEITVTVTWQRAFEELDLTVSQDGSQVDVVNVTQTSPGHGRASFTLDEEGTYGLELTARHTSGTVETASLGQVQVQAGPSPVFFAIGALLLVALVGLVLLEAYKEDEDAEEDVQGTEVEGAEGP